MNPEIEKLLSAVRPNLADWQKQLVTQIFDGSEHRKFFGDHSGRFAGKHLVTDIAKEIADVMNYHIHFVGPQGIECRGRMPRCPLPK